MTAEIARLGRSKCHFGRFAGFDPHVDAEILNAKAMTHIQAFQHQHNGLPYLHGDLTRLENEPLCRNLNPLGCGLTPGGGRKTRGSCCAEKQNKQHRFSCHKSTRLSVLFVWHSLATEQNGPKKFAFCSVNARSVASPLIKKPAQKAGRHIKSLVALPESFLSRP